MQHSPQDSNIWVPSRFVCSPFVPDPWYLGSLGLVFIVSEAFAAVLCTLHLLSIFIAYIHHTAQMVGIENYKSQKVF